jgi:beta-glucanase (GH16 family)
LKTKQSTLDKIIMWIAALGLSAAVAGQPAVQSNLWNRKTKTTTTTSSTSTTTTTTTSVGYTPFGASGNWKLTFSDEFNGTSVDVSKWAFKSYAEADNGQGNKGNQQLEWNQASNCSVANGLLTITAKPDSIISPSGIKYDWSSCLITSTPSYSFQYGFIEERVKFPKERGFWPGFWTWQAPGVNVWSETDVYEYYSDNPTKLYLTQHSGTGGSCVITPSFDPSADFHTYGASISAQGTSWYIDGIKVCSTTATPTAQTNIISNMFVYAGVPPYPGTTAYKQVDYIRAWISI